MERTLNTTFKMYAGTVTTCVLAISGTHGDEAISDSNENAVAIRAQGFNESKIHLGVADIRYTSKGDVFYAIVLGWPTAPVALPNLGKSQAY